MDWRAVRNLHVPESYVAHDGNAVARIISTNGGERWLVQFWHVGNPVGDFFGFQSLVEAQDFAGFFVENVVPRLPSRERLPHDAHRKGG